MKEFKCRASAVGKIMTNGRCKGEIGKTAYSYAELWAKEQIYNRKKDFSNKYTEKGLIMEDTSIDLLSDFDGMFYLKNDKFYENEYICGTPDIITNDEIIDIKTSWDFTTFPLFDKECPNSDYDWQLQSYMFLTGKQKARLVYCLVETPENIIESEARKIHYSFGYELDEVLNDLREKNNFTDIDIKKRIKVFEIERNDAKIEEIKERVELIRTYIKSL